MHLLKRTNLQLVNFRVIYGTKLISRNYARAAAAPSLPPTPFFNLSGGISGLTRGPGVLEGALRRAGNLKSTDN